MSNSKLFSGSGPVKLSSTKPGERIQSESPDNPYDQIAQHETPAEKIETAPQPEPVAQSKPTPKPFEFDPNALVGVPRYNAPTNIGVSPEKTSIDNVEKNLSTSWSPSRVIPSIDERSFVHPKGLIIGNVIVSAGVFVAPFCAIRGDEEEPIYIGENSAVLEGTIINALPSRRGSEKMTQRLIKVGMDEFPVYISPKVTLCQGVMIHGPAYIGKNTYIGMRALIFWAKIGSQCVIEPGALVINVEIPDGRFVPAGLSVTSQKIVSTLPVITDKYRFATINDEMLAENGEIVQGYLRGR